MNAIAGILLFPLQIDVTGMWKTKSETSNGAIIFIIIIVVIIVTLIIVNNIRKNAPVPGTGKRSAAVSSGPRFFSGFTLHRLARGVGLDHNQTKMLDFVFKADAVSDPEKSFNSTALLDRHFKRAYHIIERTADTDEEAQGRLAVLFSTRNVLENNVGSDIGTSRHLQEGTTAILIFGKEKHQAGVLFAKGENLTVECPINALGSPVKIPKGSVLTVMVFTKNNKGFSFESRIINYSSSHGHPTLLLTHSNRLKLLSQRRWRRRQAVIACSVFFVYVEGGGKKQRLTVDKRRLSGNIMDISVGGCSIKTNTAIQSGARLKIEFVQGDFTVAALGQVLRTNRTGINTTLHIKFLRVTRKSMNLINAYVYEYE
jgi:c-di-GMP-binding flagellar brake protein YcgR